MFLRPRRGRPSCRFVVGASSTTQNLPMNIRMEDILRLSVAERIQLVEAIWDSIAEDPSAARLSEEQRADLAQRLEEYRKDPSATQTWAEVREELERDE